MAPSNSLCIVQSEISLLSTALKCNSRFSLRGYQDEARSVVYKSFLQLKAILDSVSSLDEVEPLVYLTPFLEVIRSEDTTGPITGLALTAVDKFLSYGLLELPSGDETSLPPIGPGSLHSIAVAAEAIADSGTQARFVGTDRGSDEVVLMKVLHLLRTLLLVPAGSLVSDRVVREILQSCFRIGFEPKLSELLRRTAELCLASIIQLLFSRLPSLLWESQLHTNGDKEDTMMTPLCDSTDSVQCTGDSSKVIPHGLSVNSSGTEFTETCAIADGTVVAIGFSKCDSLIPAESSEQEDVPGPVQAPITEDSMNSQMKPYGLPAVHDLLHYLVSLLTPEHNSDAIISVSLSLVTIALETGADAIANCPSLLQLVQGDLTKHLILLLYSDRVWQFAAVLRVCFMLFESMRKHLKLQMEVYLQRLATICSPDNDATSYERREVALDSVVRLFLVPGLATELYVNYDCDPYCSNLFEDITKMLAKNAYPVDRLMGTHLLSLDALLAVLNTIDVQCSSTSGNTNPEDHPTQPQVISGSSLSSKPRSPVPMIGTDSVVMRRARLNRHPVDATQLPSRDQLNSSRTVKKVLILGSDQFNAKPKQGIVFLQQYHVLRSPLDPNELAHFLRENPRLDKRMIGEFLSDRGNGDVLAAYVKQFNFAGVPIDEALRVYLEAFRLPGEAPLIQRVLEQFAEHWFAVNDSPFVDADAAFTLAYAILMLNTDQHNPNSKRQNAPMTVTDFKKNLSGMNGTGDYDSDLLESVFNNIQQNEIVTPSEQPGLVRENYLWKCLLRRSKTSQGTFVHVQTGTLDADLFDLVWGPTVSALSFIFDKTHDSAVQSKAVHGFIRCAAIAAHHGMSDVLDNLVISLCKFTGLLTTGENPSSLYISFGRNAKGLLALRLVFALTSNHADILRYGWHSLLDCLLQLFRANLLPDDLTESEDFLAPSHRVRITARGCVPIASDPKGHKRSAGPGQSNRELSVLSSFYQYFTSGSAWSGSGDGDEEAVATVTEDISPQQTNADIAGGRKWGASSSPPTESRRKLQDLLSTADYWTVPLHSSQLDESRAHQIAYETVQECDVAQLIKDTKFIVDTSLNELIKALLRAIHGDSGSCFAERSSSTTDESYSMNRAPHSGHARHSTLQDNSSSLGVPSEERHAEQKPSASTVWQPVPFDPAHAVRRSVTVPSAASYYPSFCSMGGAPAEDCRAFCLELLIRILLHNRDRVTNLWPLVQCYLADLLSMAVEPTPLLERVIVGFLRLAICLLRRHEMTSQVLACLHYILLTRGDQLLLCRASDCGQQHPLTGNVRTMPVRSKSHTSGCKNMIGLQIIAGLSQLLRHHAADLPDPITDWQLIFNLLEVTGAGLRAQPSILDRSRLSHYSSLHDFATARDHHGVLRSSPPCRGYTSDSETSTSLCRLSPPSKSPLSLLTSKLILSPQSSVEEDPQKPVAPCNTPEAAWILVDKNPVSSTGFPDPSSLELPLTSGTEPKDDKSIPSVSSSAPSAEHNIPGDLCVDPPVEPPSQLLPSDTLELRVTIGSRDPTIMRRAADCLDFLIRDPAHITPDNFEHCVRTLRIFVEACLIRPARVTKPKGPLPPHLSELCTQQSVPPSRRRPGLVSGAAVVTGRPSTNAPSIYCESDSDPEEEENRRVQHARSTTELSLSPTTGFIAIQLLDLIHILFTRATSIYTEWTSYNSGALQTDDEISEEPRTARISFLWPNCWCPLIQATARLCCDCRREVRTDALAYLQRALLSPVLQSLSGSQWEDCFDRILFPLLSAFLESIALEETLASARTPASPQFGAHFHAAEYVDPRMRAIPLLTKVFLQHLRPLYQSPNFHSLWTRMLAYMKHYMQASTSDSLTDAVRESLKNVLLVMFTGTHDTPPILLRDAELGSIERTLWELTALQLSTFVPSLLDQLFPPPVDISLPNEHGVIPPCDVSGPTESLPDGTIPLTTTSFEAVLSGSEVLAPTSKSDQSFPPHPSISDPETLTSIVGEADSTIQDL